MLESCLLCERVVNGLEKEDLNNCFEPMKTVVEDEEEEEESL